MGRIRIPLLSPRKRPQTNQKGPGASATLVSTAASQSSAADLCASSTSHGMFLQAVTAQAKDQPLPGLPLLHSTWYSCPHHRTGLQLHVPLAMCRSHHGRHLRCSSLRSGRCSRVRIPAGHRLPDFPAISTPTGPTAAGPDRISIGRSGIPLECVGRTGFEPVFSTLRGWRDNQLLQRPVGVVQDSSLCLELDQSRASAVSRMPPGLIPGLGPFRGIASPHRAPTGS